MQVKVKTPPPPAKSQAYVEMSQLKYKVFWKNTVRENYWSEIDTFSYKLGVSLQTELV